MRFLIAILLAALLLPAQTSEEKDVIGVVQKIFDAIAAHDGEMIRAALLPDARIYVVRESGAASSTAVSDMVTQVSNGKAPMLERFTSAPKVLVRGRIAQVWGEYEFLLDSKLSHCGVDTATLFKTADGWKISTLSYNVERTGCPTK
ncbi:MAG: nuclear transport factor 2 family protein [Candidatus Solibacter sp.]